jgi:hypothetical protein
MLRRKAAPGMTPTATSIASPRDDGLEGTEKHERSMSAPVFAGKLAKMAQVARLIGSVRRESCGLTIAFVPDDRGAILFEDRYSLNSGFERTTRLALFLCVGVS